MTESPITHCQSIKLPLKYVSCGVLLNDIGEILIATRPDGKDMAGLWEFPGGKPYENETPENTLCRELKEELDIHVPIAKIRPLTFVSYSYETFHLIMFVFACRDWIGTPVAKEGQELKWIRPKEI